MKTFRKIYPKGVFVFHSTVRPWDARFLGPEKIHSINMEESPMWNVNQFLKFSKKTKLFKLMNPDKATEAVVWRVCYCQFTVQQGDARTSIVYSFTVIQNFECKILNIDKIQNTGRGQDHKKSCSFRFSLDKTVYLKLFWTQLKTVLLQGLCCLRPCCQNIYHEPTSAQCIFSVTTW